MIRIVLVEDHPIVRLGLHMLLDKEDEIEIVGETGSGQDALFIVRSQKPDVVLMDIGLPDMNGIEVTREIRRMNPDVAIVVLTIHNDREYLNKMLSVGASGFVPKRSAPEVLTIAIQKAAQGERYIHPSLDETDVEL